VVRREVLETLFDILADGSRSILYATHILSDISRLVDELAFLADGRISRRAAKDDLLERWRRISFRHEGPLNGIEGIVHRQSEGGSHRVISADHRATIDRLRSIGADGIEATRMTLDEIAVEIIRRTKRREPVASGKEVL
jgi:ABC-2 type transport system ATP-binding protein